MVFIGVCHRVYDLILCIAALPGLQREVWIRNLLFGICSIRRLVIHVTTRSVGRLIFCTKMSELFRFLHILINHWVGTFRWQDGVSCLTWLGGSRFLATGCVDGKVRVWDSLSGECLRTFTGHSDAIQSVSASANGDFLVSVSLDGTARAFEIGEFR